MAMKFPELMISRYPDVLDLGACIPPNKTLAVQLSSGSYESDTAGSEETGLLGLPFFADEIAEAAIDF